MNGAGAIDWFFAAEQWRVDPALVRGRSQPAGTNANEPDEAADNAGASIPTEHQEAAP